MRKIATKIVLLTALLTSSSALGSFFSWQQNQYYPSYTRPNVQVFFNNNDIQIKNIDTSSTLIKCVDFLSGLTKNGFPARDYDNFCSSGGLEHIIVNWRTRDNFKWNYGYVYVADNVGRAIHAIVATDGKSAQLLFNDILEDGPMPRKISWGDNKILLEHELIDGYIQYISDNKIFGPIYIRPDAAKYSHDVLKIDIRSLNYEWNLFDLKILNWTIIGIDANGAKRCFRGIFVFETEGYAYPKECVL